MLPYPALHASHGGIWIADADGTREVGRGEAVRVAADTPVILLNAPLTGQRLGHPELNGLDLLELFAFIHPARFAVPTPRGLAKVLGLAAPVDGAETAAFLRTVAVHLLDTLDGAWPAREGAWHTAQSLSRMGWPWAPAVAQRLEKPARAERWLFTKLPEWSEGAPRGAPRTVTIDEADKDKGEVVYLDMPPGVEMGTGTLTTRAGTSTGPSGLFAVYTQSLVRITISGNGKTVTRTVGTEEDYVSAVFVKL